MSIHVTLHARPSSAVEERTIDIANQSYVTLTVSRDAIGTPFPIDFETAAAQLAQLERMFVEPDGSFVWTAPREGPQWQIDGQLFDRAGRLLFVDLKGNCPAAELDRLLSAVGWPTVPVMFQLVRAAVFLPEAEFRRYEAIAGRPAENSG